MPMMMKKKWMTAIGTAVLAGVLVTGAAFAAAAEKPAKAPGTVSPGVQELNTEIRALRQTRMEQLKAEIEALINKAAGEGKVTPEEATRLKEGGKRFHMGGPKGERHGFMGEMKGFPRATTEEEAKAQLAESVKNESITQEQADQILQKWQAFQAKGQGAGPQPHKFGKNLTAEQLKAKLDDAVKAGRMTQEQADQMLKHWQEWHAQQSQTN